MAFQRSKDIGSEDEFLARFIGAVLESSQTPELINRVAADAEFLGLCRRLAANEIDSRFSAFCHQNQFDERSIRLRLQPVARALRLNPDVSRDPIDYYALLGVGADADEQAIKRAFRQKAHRLHPDKRPGDDGYRFLSLQAAYVHLSDPELRARYDHRRPAETWVESQSRINSRPRAWRLRRSSWLIGILTAVLVAAAYCVDVYFQESSFVRERTVLENQKAAGSERITVRPGEMASPSIEDVAPLERLYIQEQ
jgi:DnaJ-domain-containing protein 1